MGEYIEFIPNAGACAVSTKILNGTGSVRWMVCTAPQAPADNRCQILSDIDISECLVDPVSWKIVNSNALRAIEPALIGIGDLSVGSNLELVRHDRGMSSSDSASGWGIRPGDMCIPEQFR